MADSYQDLTKKLNDATLQAVRSVLATLTDTSGLQAYNQDGVGNFPYWLTTGPQRSFNNMTYEWIDQVVAYDPQTGALKNTGDRMTGQLATVVYPKLSYALNGADSAKLQATQTQTAAQGNALITAYTQNVAPIPPGTANNLDYVTSQILGWGPTDKPLTLMALENSLDLREDLPNMPASGQAVLPALTIWLNASSSTLSLQSAVSSGTNWSSYLGKAVRSPNADSSVATLDPKDATAQPVKKPKWTINEDANTLLNGLKNSEKKVTVSISARSMSSATSELQINGQAAGRFGWDFLTFGVSGKVSYNVYTANTSAASVSVEIIYPGVTAVTVKPMAAQRSGNGGIGWMDQTDLTQASKNGQQLPPPESGYVFTPALPSSISMRKQGNFGYLNTIIISNQPTIKITYSGGDSSTYKSVFQQSSSWQVKLLGIFTVASGSQSYYKAKVEEHASGSGFSVTIAPDGTEFNVPDAQKTANVLAANPTWPGDAG
jgi:hypothetical protein